MNHRFYHIRRRDRDGQINPLGGITICLTRGFLPYKFDTAVVTFARCRDDERFCRTIGRQVSLGRFNTWADHAGRNVFSIELTVDPARLDQKGVLEALLSPSVIHCFDKDPSLVSILRKAL